MTKKMNEQTKKLLTEFVDANIKRLEHMPHERRNVDMGSPFRCALAPNILLPSIKDDMTSEQYEEYTGIACSFTEAVDIPRARKAFQRWLKKQ